MIERAVGIDDHCARAKARLVGDGFDDAATGEAIDDERGDADGVEFARPAIDVGGAAARSRVDQNHGGVAFEVAGEAKFGADARGSSCGASEKCFVGQSYGLERMNFRADREGAKLIGRGHSRHFDFSASPVGSVDCSILVFCGECGSMRRSGSAAPQSNWSPTVNAPKYSGPIVKVCTRPMGTVSVPETAVGVRSRRVEALSFGTQLHPFVAFAEIICSISASGTSFFSLMDKRLAVAAHGSDAHADSVHRHRGIEA